MNEERTADQIVKELEATLAILNTFGYKTEQMTMEQAFRILHKLKESLEDEDLLKLD